MTGLIRFTDSAGREWEVWEIGARPPAADQAVSAANAPHLPERWLCFATGSERRRLLTYPRTWHTLTARELETLCRAATPGRPTPPGFPAIPPDARGR